MPYKNFPKSKNKDTKLTYPTIIGKAYEQLKVLVRRFAENDYPVLFVGQRGSGKELFAQYFMASSKRSGQKMTINCAAIPDNLLGSEIFGHERGSFTDAVSERRGKLRTCAKGILFLDELGDASEHLQAAILRVAEHNSFSPVGSDEEKKVDTLIIAATNKPQALRNELIDRFHVLYVPPLQKRDIPALSEHFLKRPLRKEILEELRAREYPGNVRELERVCQNLNVTREDSIFAPSSTSLGEAWHFDYERFEREITTWNKYLQPLIKQHGPEGMEYKYMDWDPNWIDMEIWPDREMSKLLPARRLVHGSQPYDSQEIKKSAIYSHGTLDLIEWLRMGAHKEERLPSLPRQLQKSDECEEKGSDLSDDFYKNRIDTINPHPVPMISPEDVVPIFRKHMKEYFRMEILPYVLEQLYRNYNIASKKVEMKKPPLTHLLDLSLKEALKDFEHTYLTYALEKHAGNRDETARVLKVPLKTMNSRIRRLKKSKAQ